MVLWEAGHKRDPQGKGPIGRTFDFFASFLSQIRRGVQVDKRITNYNSLFAENVETKVRNQAYASMVDSFYELVTNFYEWGWGASFHLAYRLQGESFSEAMRRHEYHMASYFSLPPKSKVLDAGCGIGGPCRNITRMTGWDVTGVTLNQYQVTRGSELIKQQKLAGSCRLVQGDFHKLPFQDETFDGCFSIEATCHAPDRRVVFKEILRVLKPGAIFATYDWGLTDEYDQNNAEHRKIKHDIEEGNSLPELINVRKISQQLVESGFEPVHSRDLALDPHQSVTWYHPITPTFNPFCWPGFQFNVINLNITVMVLSFLELIRIVPQGTSKVQQMLQKGGIGCADGGRTGTFTPMYLVVGRKPLSGPASAG